MVYEINNYESILQVIAIKYSSPGFTDLSGLAQTIGHLKDVLFYYFPNNKTKKEIEILAQERIKLIIDNLKSVGIENSEIQKLILYRNLNLLGLIKLIEENKIVSIESLDKNRK
jgi:antitoxin component YwqK of YwqJK toxin-antitoxin module